MPPYTRFEITLGRATLAALRQIQRRSLGVRVHRHRDRRGRVTPFLEVGTPRRGTIVWLHGFSDRFDTILLAASKLRDEYRIVSPSLPAFGEGWVDEDERHTFGSFANWMETVVGDIVSEPFHLAGNSLGGATALLLAARMPDRVRSVVALNNAGVELAGVDCAHAEMRGGHNLFEVREPEDHERLLRRIFHEPMDVPRTVKAHLYDETRSRADWYVRVAKDLAESDVREQGEGWRSFLDLSAVPVPTLALWGDQDTLFPVSHGEHVARTVPNGSFERLEGVGHCAHLEAPGRLADALRRWIARTT